MRLQEESSGGVFSRSVQRFFINFLKVSLFVSVSSVICSFSSVVISFELRCWNGGCVGLCFSM